MLNDSPSSKRRLNWLPSRAKSVPALKVFAKTFLDRGDVAADGELAAELGLQMGCRGEVIGMDVGPRIHSGSPPSSPDPGDQAVRAAGGGTSGLGVVVKDAVDHCAAHALAVEHDAADGAGISPKKPSMFMVFVMGRSCGLAMTMPVAG